MAVDVDYLVNGQSWQMQMKAKKVAFNDNDGNIVSKKEKEML